MNNLVLIYYFIVIVNGEILNSVCLHCDDLCTIVHVHRLFSLSVLIIYIFSIHYYVLLVEEVVRHFANQQFIKDICFR